MNHRIHVEPGHELDVGTIREEAGRVYRARQYRTHGANVEPWSRARVLR